MRLQSVYPPQYVLSPSFQRTTHQIYVHKNPFCVVSFNIIVNLPIIMKLNGKHYLYYLEHLYELLLIFF